MYTINTTDTSSDVKATILADNRSSNPVLFPTEHGLSILLDTGSLLVLLDTGASDLFIRNARTLGMDLADVDYVFLSHGHNDHAGGLRAFLEINDKAKIQARYRCLSRLDGRRLRYQDSSLSESPISQAEKGPMFRSLMFWLVRCMMSLGKY